MEIVEKHQEALRKRSMSVSLDQVQALRNLLSEDYCKHKELYDERDYNRFMDSNDDWHARRWIIYQPDMKKALQLAKSALRWRKQIKLNDFNPYEFPREFYEYGMAFECGQDKQGRRVVYIRTALFKPDKEISNLVKMFITFLLDQIDKRSHSKGFILVSDMRGVGWDNMDLSLVKYSMSLMDKFPVEPRMSLLVGLPPFLKPLIKIVWGFLPSNMLTDVRFINLEQLSDFIDADQLPKVFGGTYGGKYKLVPIGAKSASEFEHFSKSYAKKMRDYVDSVSQPDEYVIVGEEVVIR